MEVVIQKDAECTSRLAARYLAQRIRRKPDTVLGLATGGTPVATYRELIRIHREENLDFSQVTTFNLDEYVGLAPDHPCSYRYFMEENLFRHVNIPAANTHLPDGLGEDVPRACTEYEAAIQAAGGIDLQVVGIGTDGHLGFNEPSSSLTSRTRIKTLTEETRRDNARFFDDPDQVPVHCITMGLGTIMDSLEILFLAFGEHKAEVVARAVEGPLTAMIPASVLQWHAHVKVFIDEAAASKLERKHYYKWVYDNKPPWQRF